VLSGTAGFGGQVQGAGELCASGGRCTRRQNALTGVGREDRRLEQPPQEKDLVDTIDLRARERRPLEMRDVAIFEEHRWGVGRLE
jgi:hypothetical protein